MRKRIALAAAGTAMMFASTVGAASAETLANGSSETPAVIRPITVDSPSAITAWDNCLHGQACVFQNSNGGGLLWVVPWAGSFKLANYDMNNRISALWNRSGGTLSLYDGDNYSNLLGQYGAYGPPINVPTGINDRASSLTVY
ncbi:peptidase inhibitor family I36 protein [Streptomyces sp. BE20]|uniref:peptidase inhibitor family I36 protein n=1 Tax=Streptomyces sp. BE20 TaxID=3002525 RepID=UPI002E78948E|nr:peptidase inhibitor family I36 protein [Streptomyces sp. BE20]MEE1824278.1 peptidase inhibitor family I36 protein [Streptomyces sp. BE20]